MKIAIKEIKDLGDELWVTGWVMPKNQKHRIELLAADSTGRDPDSKIHVASHELGASKAFPDQPEEAYTFTIAYSSEALAPVTITAVSPDNEKDAACESISADGELIRKPELKLLRKSVRLCRGFLKEKNKKEYIKAVLRQNPYIEAHEYGRWLKNNLPGVQELKRQSQTKLPYEPLISILTYTHDNDTKNVMFFIEDLFEQSYKNWQLCIVDSASSNKDICNLLKQYEKADSRITFVHLEDNKGPAGCLNTAMELAKGEWVAVAGAEDLLSPDILYEYVTAINRDKTIDMLYCDEDCFDSKIGLRREPLFKPDFNIDLLTCTNYMRNMVMAKRGLFEEIGEFDSRYDRVLGYDINLKLSEKSKRVYHVPMVLYSRRGKPFETGKRRKLLGGLEDDASRAIDDHYRRAGIPAKASRTLWKACYRTDFSLTEKPLVSVLIPNKDHGDDLLRCINSLLEKATYDNYEIIIIENNSTQPETFALYEKLKRRDSRISVVTWDKGFNYSAINNYAARFAKGDYLLLLNNDTELITPEIFESMLGYCMREDVGAVGAKLLYDDNTVQHAGVLIGVERAAHHVFLHYPENEPGYMGRACVSQDMRGVTAACLMVKKSVYEEVGGLDEEFVVAYNDVDFCMKLDAAGYKNVFDAFVFLYHYESKSRGFDLTPEAQKRFESEKKRLSDKWKEKLDFDPYYNKNLSLKHGYYHV